MPVDNPLLRPGVIEDRAYQAAIAATAAERSTLVVLPTGLGKTVVAARTIAEVLRRKGGRILFLAPTKPLVEQHASFLRDVLIVEDVSVFTGEVTAPADREILWRESKIVVSTPQVIRNDLKHERFDLHDVSLIVFDEAHRAVGDYAYVTVAEAYREEPDPLVLGMTASPGNRTDAILEVCANLGITAVEIRTHLDPDVVPYVQDVEFARIVVEPSDTAREVGARLRKAFQDEILTLKKCGFLAGRPRPSTKDVLATGQEVRALLDRGVREGRVYTAATAAALAMKIDRAVELAETQGLEAFLAYFRRAEEGAKSRADRLFLKRPAVREAVALASEGEKANPKVRSLVSELRRQFARKPDSRVIVFAHYRDQSTIVVRELAKLPGIRPARFVGQATKGEDVGLSQKEQIEILDRFRAGDVNVLVSSSVGEEGLDIPSTDLVVFYEPVPSEIRTIQRRGRTGRLQTGRVAILVTRGTRDEAYFYSARRKEQRMHTELEKLRQDLKQRIFVGEPGGETFVSVAPEDRIASLREEAAAARDRSAEAPPRRPAKKGQTTVEDF